MFCFLYQQALCKVPPECSKCVSICRPQWLSSRNSFQPFIWCQAQALETQKSRIDLTGLCLRLSPFPKEVKAECPSCLHQRRCCKAQRVTGKKKKKKKSATILKYYLQNTHKINTRNAVLGLQIWWHWPISRRIWVSFSGSRYGFVPLCPWPQLTHLVTSTCPGKMPPWVLGTG